jgi:outer membrane protein
MKKLSIAVNVVLIILVAILFYLHFSTPRPAYAGVTPGGRDSSAQTTLRIAFVNLDSLENNYGYFQQKSKELAKKQQDIQTDLGKRAQEIQDEIADLQKKAPTMTQSQGEAAQKSILQKRQDLQQREQNLRQKFLEEQQAFNTDLHARLDAFLKKYNADKHYTYILSYSEQASDILYKDAAYDITADVIRGLNAEQDSGK